METFRYTLNDQGFPIAFGFGDFENSLNGTEPFNGFDIENWRKVNATWERVYEEYPIPVNPIVVYEMVPPCPVDNNVTSRKIYWIGEQHEVMERFRINILVLHFNVQGNRVTKWDKKTWTQADVNTMIDNPLNPGTQVNEYDFFMDIVKNGQLTLIEAVLLGIQRADLDGTINNRIYDNI